MICFIRNTHNFCFIVVFCSLIVMNLPTFFTLICGEKSQKILFPQNSQLFFNFNSTNLNLSNSFFVTLFFLHISPQFTNSSLWTSFSLVQAKKQTFKLFHRHNNNNNIYILILSYFSLSFAMRNFMCRLFTVNSVCYFLRRF